MLVEAKTLRAASEYASSVHRKVNGDRLVRWAIMIGFIFLIIIISQDRASP